MMDTDLAPTPKHDGGGLEPAPFRVVAAWPAPAFVENLAVAPDGAVYLTVHSHSRIDRYDPATGQTAVFAELPAPPMGLALDASGALWVTGGTMRTAPGFIWRLGPNGEVEHWAELPDASFLNGCAVHPNGRELLVCESGSGRIFSVDMRRPDAWSIWLEDERIGPGDSPYPGANGVKIRGGAAWISVSARYEIVRAPILSDGSAGPLKAGFTEILADDFAFGASGALYVTTHPAQSVVRIDASGARTTIAGPDQGAVGSTACAFGTAPGDEQALYVSTDGGFIVPHEGAIQDAKLVRLEVGEAGYPLLGERRAG
ncbi:MAG: Sugar lactone lactonase YvrE [Caulobacteraceae bacterium]|jgi:sugar lactone lactonase YvrE|nr:Sugar lactone lactonase YvrE [Caulobacteraceae bacterium]